MDPLTFVIIALILGNAVVYSLVYRKKRAYEKMKQEWKQREETHMTQDIGPSVQQALK